MNIETKKCALCAEMIPTEATSCPFCGAKYEVTTRGYCTKDHQVVEANEAGLCSKCGGELIDKRVESHFLEEPPAIPLPSAPSISRPVQTVHTPQTERTPKSSKPSWGTRLEGALTLPFVVGLLNLTGLGLGYIYSKKWKSWIGMLFINLLILISVAGLTTSVNPNLLAGILVAWLILMALHGWWRAKKMNVSDRIGLEKYRSFAFYAAMVILIAELVGFLVFRHAGQKTFESAKTAYKAGDCTTALPYLSKVDTTYRLTFIPEIPQVADWYGECDMIEKASTYMKEGYYEGAIKEYERFLHQYPKSGLGSIAQAGAADTYRAWAAQLRTEGNYEEALLNYKILSRTYPYTPAGTQVNTWITETYIEWANKIKEEGDYTGAIEKINDYLSEFPDTSSEADMKNLASQIYDEWADRLLLEGNYEEALKKYEIIHREYPNTPAGTQFNTWIAETYLKWANKNREDGDYPGAIEKINDYLNKFSDTSSEADMKNLAFEIYNEWADQLLLEENYEEALQKYEIINSEYPNAPAALSLDAVINDLIKTGTEDLADGKYCHAVTIFEALSKSSYLPETELNVDLADALFICGQEKYAAEEYDKAIAHFEALIADYPGHSLVSQAEAALIDARVAQMNVAGTGELPPPAESGWTTPGTSAVVVSNDSPERLEFLLSGPDSKSVIIEACESCTTYFIVGPLFCPEKGPSMTVSVVPGTYQVVVQAINDPSITPWSGTWELADGRKYFNCFLIVTR